MKRFFAILSSVLCLLPPVSSASATEPAVSPVERLTSLGQGLAYLSIRSLADSEKALRSAVPGAGDLVLDLRHVAAENDSLDALRFAVGNRPGGTALFILVSPATPTAVAEIIKQSAAPTVTLGVAGSVPGPKVVVKTDAETDRRAHDALAAGTPVETLISGKIDKERFDEATLVHEFKNGNPEAAPPTPPDPTAAKQTGTAEKPVPLIDRVLQRAVHLHQALLALRR